MVLSHKLRNRRAGFVKPFLSPTAKAPQCGNGSDRQRIAVKTAEVNFICPNCGSLNEVMKAGAVPEAIDPDIACPTCGGPLPAREGQFVLKYFLLRKTCRGPKWQRLPLHAEPE
jgi:predicted RNA-binding Zn-ribbon protein involved in translation (DUF1610 family)